MTHDRPILGILLMLGFCVLAPLQDAMAKILGSLVPLYTLLLVRFGTQGGMLWPLCRATGRSMALPRRIVGLAWLRAALHILGIGCMFTALQYLPIADAIAIAFVMPFIMLLLGWAVLGEAVGLYRLTACAVGFFGTLLVIQPAFADVGWPALLPMVVALVFALYMLVTRSISKETDPIALQAVNGGMAVVILVPVGVVLWVWDVDLWAGWPEPFYLVMLLAVGVLGTLAHLLMTWSLRFAPSTTLAPMQYLEIPMATLIGWLVFGDWPNGLAAIGILITIAAGLFIIWREQTRAAPASAQSSPS